MCTCLPTSVEKVDRGPKYHLPLPLPSLLPSGSADSLTMRYARVPAPRQLNPSYILLWTRTGAGRFTKSLLSLLAPEDINVQLRGRCRNNITLAIHSPIPSCHPCPPPPRPPCHLCPSSSSSSSLQKACMKVGVSSCTMPRIKGTKKKTDFMRFYI